MNSKSSSTYYPAFRGLLLAIAILLLAISGIKGYAQSGNDSLVSYYTFCDCTAKDVSGNNRNGTMIGSPQCLRGKRDYGLLMNQNPGTNACGLSGGQYIQLPTLGPIWSQGFTVCAWIRFDVNTNFERIIDIGNDNGEAGGLPVWFGREGNTNNLALESWINNDGIQARSVGRLTAVNAITNGNIEYYCATIDKDTMRIYVNGVLKAQRNGNPILNVTRTSNFIGHSNWCFNDPDFRGFLDEVRIYNRALSGQEIDSLYQLTNVNDFTATTSCNSLNAGFSIPVATNIDSLKWNFDDAVSGAQNTAMGQTTSHTFSAPGSYSVQLIAYKTCLNDTVTKTVRVHQINQQFLGPDAAICPGTPKVLKFNTPGATYLWQDGSTADSLLINNAGLYWQQVTIDGCIYRDSVTVTSLRKISAENKTICEGQSYSGYNTSGTYIDTFPLANGCDSIRTLTLVVNTKTIAPVNKTICKGDSYLGYTTTGTYYDTLRYTNGCDSIVHVINLLVQQPGPVQSSNATICQGSSYTLPWGSVVNTAGVYRDTLRYNTGCDSLISEVTVNVRPVQLIATDASICQGGSYLLPWGGVVTASGTYRDTLRYNAGCDSIIRQVTLTVTAAVVNDVSKSICTGETYTLPWGQVVSNAGIYRDTVRTAIGCDSLVRIIRLTVNSTPTVSAGKSNDVDCILGTSKLLATGGSKYVWSPAATLNNANIANPVASPAVTTMYHVQVINDAACTAEDSVLVQVNKGLAENGFIVPNAFTPNGDGKNDCFGVSFWGSVENFSLSIFNRWGKRVFFTKDNAQCWDGTVKGNKADSGVYVYFIKGTTICGPVERKGTVLLIR